MAEISKSESRKKKSGKRKKRVSQQGSLRFAGAELDIDQVFLATGIISLVEGELGADGVFYAQTMTAKCPTKYQAAEDEQHAAMNAEGGAQ